MGNASAGGLAYVPSTGGGTGGGSFSAGVGTGGNTQGSTGLTGTQFYFAGGNNITLSQATDGNGGTMSIIGAAGGAGVGTSVSGNLSMTLNSNGLALNASNLAGTSTG